MISLRNMIYRLSLIAWKYWPFGHRTKWLAQIALNARFMVGAMALIEDEQGRVLLGRHTYRTKHPWGMPGGWLKANESLSEALAREVREEIGLVVEVGEVVWIGSGYQQPRLDIVCRAKVIGGQLQPSLEISEAHYFAYDELPAGLMPDQRAIFGMLRRRGNRPGAIASTPADLDPDQGSQ